MSDDDLTVRPMTEADRPGMRASTRAAFDDLLQRLGTPAQPEGRPTTTTSNSGAAIVGQLLEIDAAGAWVATVDQWAINVTHRTGLSLAPIGPLCRQGDTGPLAPYLPHADIL